MGGVHCGGHVYMTGVCRCGQGMHGGYHAGMCVLGGRVGGAFTTWACATGV